MKTILYRIPNKFFPGVFVKKPFHAKVNYDVKNGKVEIYDVAISALCMDHIQDTAVLRKEMQERLQSIEAAPIDNSHVNQVIANAIAPHINH